MEQVDSLKPTVAVLVPYKFIPPTSGGEHVCYKFALALSKLTKTICISTQQNNGVTEPVVIELLEQTKTKYFNPLSIIRIAKLFRRQNVRLCIVNQPYFAIIAFLACKISGTKLAIYSHNLEFRRFRYNFRAFLPVVYLLELFVYRTSDCVFFISELEMKIASRVFRLENSKLYYAPIIVSRPKTAYRFSTPADSSFSIIFFGNFSYLPNIIGLNIFLNEICPRLANDLSFNYTVKIFGSGLDGHKQHVKLKRSNLSAVAFMGYVDDLDAQVSVADVMVNPISIHVFVTIWDTMKPWLKTLELISRFRASYW